MEEVKRSLRRPAILLLLLVALVLTGCGVQASGNNPGVSTDGERVYIAYAQSVYAVDVATQREVWRYPLDPNGTEYYAPPSIGEDRIILGDAGAKQGFLSPGVIGSVYAVNNVDSGSPTPIWQSSTDEPVARDRLVAPALQANGQVFVGTADNALVALDANTGSEQWRVELGHSVWGSPAFSDGTLVVGSMDKSIYGFDAVSGNINWQHELGGAIAASIVIDENVAYAGSFDGKLYAFDVASGNELFSAEATNWIWNAPSLANGMAYFGDASGQVFAIDKRDGAQEWQTDVGGAVEAGVLAVDDTVYVSVIVPVESSTENTGKLMALNADTGTIRWQIERALPLTVAPQSVADHIAVGYVNDDNAVVLDVFDADGKQVWSYTPAE